MKIKNNKDKLKRKIKLLRQRMRNEQLEDGAFDGRFSMKVIEDKKKKEDKKRNKNIKKYFDEYDD
jgi:hypothetical protein